MINRIKLTNKKPDKSDSYEIMFIHVLNLKIKKTLCCFSFLDGSKSLGRYLFFASKLFGFVIRNRFLKFISTLCKLEKLK